MRRRSKMCSLFRCLEMNVVCARGHDTFCLAVRRTNPLGRRPEQNPTRNLFPCGMQMELRGWVLHICGPRGCYAMLYISMPGSRTNGHEIGREYITRARLRDQLPHARPHSTLFQPASRKLELGSPATCTLILTRQCACGGVGVKRQFYERRPDRFM